MAKKITLNIIAQKIASLQTKMEKSSTSLENKMDAMDVSLSNQIHGLAVRMDDLEVNMRLVEGDMNIVKGDVGLLKTGVQNIDERLDTIEIAIVEQNHEGRIRKLEHHAGLAKAA